MLSTDAAGKCDFRRPNRSSCPERLSADICWRIDLDCLQCTPRTTQDHHLICTEISTTWPQLLNSRSGCTASTVPGGLHHGNAAASNQQTGTPSLSGPLPSPVLLQVPGSARPEPAWVTQDVHPSQTAAFLRETRESATAGPLLLLLAAGKTKQTANRVKHEWLSKPGNVQHVSMAQHQLLSLPPLDASIFLGSASVWFEPYFKSHICFGKVFHSVARQDFIPLAPKKHSIQNTVQSWFTFLWCIFIKATMIWLSVLKLDWCPSRFR